MKKGIATIFSFAEMAKERKVLSRLVDLLNQSEDKEVVRLRNRANGALKALSDYANNPTKENAIALREAGALGVFSTSARSLGRENFISWPVWYEREKICNAFDALHECSLMFISEHLMPFPNAKASQEAREDVYCRTGDIQLFSQQAVAREVFLPQLALQVQCEWDQKEARASFWNAVERMGISVV